MVRGGREDRVSRVRTATVARWDSAVAEPVVSRADRTTLAPPTIIGSGGRRGEMVLAHAGVLTYTHADDPSIPKGATVRELIPGEVLADTAFLDSLKGIPVIVNRAAHAGRVRPSTAKALRVGTVLGARFDAASGEVVAEYVIDTAEGLAALDRGWRAVSLRYDAEMDHAGAGEWEAPDGTRHRYDARRKRHLGANHVLLTDAGQRAPRAVLRADAIPGDLMDPTAIALALAGLGITVDPEGLTPEAIGAAVRTRFDALTAERDTASGQLAALTAERADAVSRADAVAAELAALKDKQSRPRFDAVAARHGVKVTEAMSCDEVARAVVKAAVPAYTDDKPAEYVRAAFDLLEAQPVASRWDALRGSPRETAREVARSDAPALDDSLDKAMRAALTPTGARAATT
jgi:hypothetical protein